MPGPGTGTLMGVTSYIRDVLRAGVPFSRPRPRAKRPHRAGPRTKWGAAQAGLKLGRAVDRAFVDLVRRNTGAETNTVAMKRALAVMAALRKHGLAPVAAQVAVDMPLLGLKTTLDAVFKDARNNVVVVELKTTTASSAEHAAAYHTPCTNRPVLRRGGANTEHTAHMLQTAFGVIAHPKAKRGVVVVSCTDGALVYDTVPKKCYEMHVFQAKAPPANAAAAAAPQLGAWARVPKWPGAPAEAALARVRTAVTATALNGRVALLSNGGAAVAARTPAAAVSKRFRAACKAAYAEADRHTKLYVVCPQRGRFVAYKFQL